MPTVGIGDIQLHYEEQGNGDPLVLIMGLGADANAWMRQVPEFSRHHRTVTFDNRGVGRSSKPPGPYSICQMADDTARLMTHIGLDRAHIVGVSMGGMIAQELALNHAERVATLVLACTYPEPGPETGEVFQSSLAFFGASDGATDQLAGIDPMAIFQHLLPTVFSERFVNEELVFILPQLTAGLAHGFSIEALLGQVTACLSHRTTDRLHAIAAPTLVLAPLADRLVPPKHSETLAASIPGARLVKLEGGTHGMNLEMAEPFNAEVLDFLAAHPLAGAG